VRRALTGIGLRQVFFDPRLVSEERFEEYVAPVLRPGAVAAISSLLRTRPGDSAAFEALLRGIRAPTLILWGREDRWIPLAQADRFAAAIPRSRLTVLAGCGHLPQEERPREVAALLASFFASAP
jgi:pimeloyl-ACP methyl ester carboxylesterase